MIIPAEIQISKEELSSVDSFRKGRDTAVLTVMFTDIEGFTQMTESKGEVYSAEIRDQHDAILTREIEKNKRGLIVKFIGDAVMAIFAEPSAAVECALDIQGALQVFNRNETKLDDIDVRIGLHMGQVSVENNLQVDVFGRHVNRAARIESLAHGGQILLSYPVFDSAKGWLGSHQHIKWVEHGCYQLKGIDEETQIFEVLDKRLGLSTTAPEGKLAATVSKAKKSGSSRILRSALIAFIATVAAVFGWQAYNTAEVTFRQFYGEDPYVNIDTALVMEGKPGDELRKSLTEFKPGTHVIHYDVNYITRYYSEIDVTRGENFIKAKFQESRLPDLNLRYELDSDEETGEASKTKEFSYIEYDAQGQRIEHTATLTIHIKSRRDQQLQAVVHQVDWKVFLDGKELRSDSLEASQAFDKKESTRFTLEEPFYSDDFHKYTYRYYTTQGAMDFTLHGDLAEYSYLK